MFVSMCRWLKQLTAAKFTENVIKSTLASGKNDHVWSGIKPAAVTHVPSSNANKTEKEQRVLLFMPVKWERKTCGSY